VLVAGGGGSRCFGKARGTRLRVPHQLPHVGFGAFVVAAEQNLCWAPDDAKDHERTSIMLRKKPPRPQKPPDRKEPAPGVCP